MQSPKRVKIDSEPFTVQFQSYMAQGIWHTVQWWHYRCAVCNGDTWLAKRYYNEEILPELCIGCQQREYGPDWPDLHDRYFTEVN